MVGHKRRLQDSFCPGGGTGAEFLARLPVSLPVKPLVQKLKGETRRFIQEEVDYLLVKAAIEPVRDRNQIFYSNLYLVKKTDSGLRPVINLRGLNCYINKKTFRMSTIKYVSQII